MRPKLLEPSPFLNAPSCRLVQPLLAGKSMEATHSEELSIHNLARELIGDTVAKLEEVADAVYRLEQQPEGVPQ